MELLWSITTDADNSMNQSELRANTCSRRRARENACEEVTIGFGFRLFSQSQSGLMQNQSTCEITFDIQLKTALICSTLPY